MPATTEMANRPAEIRHVEDGNVEIQHAVFSQGVLIGFELDQGASADGFGGDDLRRISAGHSQPAAGRQKRSGVPRAIPSEVSLRGQRRLFLAIPEHIIGTPDRPGPLATARRLGGRGLVQDRVLAACWAAWEAGDGPDGLEDYGFDARLAVMAGCQAWEAEEAADELGREGLWPWSRAACEPEDGWEPDLDDEADRERVEKIEEAVTRARDAKAGHLPWAESRRMRSGGTRVVAVITVAD